MFVSSSNKLGNGLTWVFVECGGVEMNCRCCTQQEDICNVQQSLQSARENARYGNVFNASENFC